MKRRTLTLVAVPGLVASMLVSPLAGTATAQPGLTAESLAPADRTIVDKAPTSALAESDPELLASTSPAPVPVLVKLDYDSVATYGGHIEGFAATSPAVTGRPLDGSQQERRYEAGVAEPAEEQFADRLADQVPGAEIDERLRTVYGGVAVTVPANRADDIAALPGVVAVQEDALRKPLTDASPEFLGAPTLYDALGDGTANAGEGTILGNLDSGVWPEHPSFADLGNLPAPPGPARACEFGDNPLTEEADPFVCQNKLIGGAHFTDTYDAVIGDDVFPGTARDSNGHGTHTSSTSAGNIVEDVSILGSPLPAIHGLAPGAYVMEYKVCGPQGCFSSDSAAAVGQAILDGVDVINFSISGGTSPFTDPVELAFLDAYAAGVFVSASAGNAGPTAGTVNHVSPWVTTVAASTQTREFATTLTLNADNGDTFTAEGASITPGAGPLPVVMSSAAPYSNALCDAPAPAGIFEGKIVACERGVVARVAKGYNVLQGGAEGMILYNPSLADIETDTHWVPTVHLADGTDFVAFMDSHAGVIGSFPPGEAQEGQGDVMAAFSSRGPGGNVIKPDVTAPGVQILAGDTPIQESIASGPPGEYYQAIAGTSMSSPHTAGAALLLKALHPDWTPGQIKSALMTTATTAVVKEDTTTPADPFDMGAGRIDLNVAGNPGLTFDESAADMVALGNDAVNAVHINIPSVNAPVLPGRLTTVRTAKNVTDGIVLYRVQTTAPEGSSITVSPRFFLLRPGEQQDLTITLQSDAPTAQYFGEIRLEPLGRGHRDRPTLHLPVAFVPQQGAVNLVSDCTPDEIARREISTCEITAQNNSFNDTTVDLRTTLSRHLVVDSVDGASRVDRHTVQALDVRLGGNKPGVPSVEPGSLSGYLPLDDFGITPTAVGDEELLTFTVPAYVYAGVTYNTIGVTSNGYVIAGEATAQDVEFAPPAGPDPARPNNVLAPFWTDLNGDGAPGILVGVLTDGTNSWVVVEFRLNVFGTTSQRVFQTWIGVNGTEDITYAYDPNNLPADPNGQPFLVGAENIIGEGDMVSTLPTEDLRVTSSDPTPGDSITYTVGALGRIPGLGTVTTTMDSPDVPGTTIVTSEVRVRPR